MMNPGGTGRPIRVISARFAPLPPSRSLRSLWPSAKSYTSLGTADLRRDDTDRYSERSDQFNLNDFGGIPPGQGPWSRLRWLARLVVSAIVEPRHENRQTGARATTCASATGSGGLRRRMSDDHYRAFGVVHAVRADRVDKFSDEFSVTMTADDEQPGVAGRVHEDMAGPPGCSSSAVMVTENSSENLSTRSARTACTTPNAR